MSKICQFPINNRSDYIKQLITIIDMIQKARNSKTDKADKNFFEIRRNQDNGNSNINSKCLKFVNLLSIMTQDILINLQLQ